MVSGDHIVLILSCSIYQLNQYGVIPSASSTEASIFQTGEMRDFRNPLIFSKSSQSALSTSDFNNWPPRDPIIPLIRLGVLIGHPNWFIKMLFWYLRTIL